MSRGDFWSRRRAAVEAEEAAEARARAAAEAEAEIDAERAALAGKSDAEVLAELGLPEPESLVSGDDVRAFMARAVPQHLRRRALRKLWTTDPTFACLDGLVDYAADYTDAAAVTPNLRTAFRVGTGMIERLDALAPGGAAAQAAPAPEEAPAPAEEAPKPEEAVDAEPAAPPAEPAPAAVEAASAPEPVPRRMAFQFDEEER